MKTIKDYQPQYVCTWILFSHSEYQKIRNLIWNRYAVKITAVTAGQKDTDFDYTLYFEPKIKASKFREMEYYITGVIDGIRN